MISQPKTTKEEFELIAEIVNRALPRLEDVKRLDLMMDIEFAHADIPIKLEELATAPEGSFMHDVTGIIQHMDRDTGKLGDCFVPRYAVNA